ncbi:MAG: cytochrome d ubiquinol oxidase subunit II, partial [Giesbergeria sp.]|nr:cytochrome d ubiquinol oxidase subunit II [Giesbergeria sp.]
VAMLVMHGSAWLRLKTDGAVAERARSYGRIAAVATVLLYAAAGVVLWLWVDGYRITSSVVPAGPSNPLLKTAEVHAGAWFGNYMAQPALWLVPALGLLGAMLAWLGLHLRREWFAMLASTVSIACIVLSVGVSMFPFLLPSSMDPRFSLTLWDSSSSHLTLFIMLVSTAIFLPLILAYTSWVYSVLRGKVDADAISEERGHAY